MVKFSIYLNRRFFVMSGMKPPYSKDKADHIWCLITFGLNNIIFIYVHIHVCTSHNVIWYRIR